MGKSSVDDIWASLKSSTMKKASDAMKKQGAVSKAASDSTQHTTLAARSGEGTTTTTTATGSTNEEAVKSLSQLTDLSLESVMVAIRRDLNYLTDANRSTRTKGAERLRMRLLEDKAFVDEMAKAKAKDLLPSVLSDNTLLAPIARMLNDPSEKCREAALHFVRAAAASPLVPDTAALFQRVIPVIRERMGTEGTFEASEELRLCSVQLLRGGISQKCAQETVKAYLDQILPIVTRALDDPFHEVKKECCQFIEESPKLLQSLKEGVAEHLRGILQCIVRNMSHPHWKVRLMLVRAVDTLVASLRPSMELVDKFVVTILHEVCFDKAHQVRRKTYESIASWLTMVQQQEGNKEGVVGGGDDDDDVGCRVPMYAEAFLPYFMMGLLDDEQDIRESSRESLASLCRKNAENGCYLQISKKKIDDAAAAGDASSRMEIEGEGQDNAEAEEADPVKRMVRHHLKHMTTVCKRNFAEWTTSKKLAASRLLFTTTQISESHIAPYLDVVVPLMCNAVGDEHEEIAYFIVASTHHIGSSCDPSSWVYLILDWLHNPKCTIMQKANTLVVLAGLVRGCSLSQKQMENESLTQVASALASDEIRGAGHYAINMQVLAVVTNLLEAFGGQCKIVGQDLYRILLQLQAVKSHHSTSADNSNNANTTTTTSSSSSSSQIQSHALDATGKLARLCGYETTAAFASDHSRDLLHLLCASHVEWTKDSPDQYVFSALLFGCTAEVLTSLADEIMSVFAGCLQEDRDPHLRLEMLKLMDRLLEDSEGGRNAFLGLGGHSRKFLEQVLLPPAVWQVGKTAASIRFHAIVVLGTFFREKLLSSEELAAMLIDDKLQLLPTIHSCLEEDYYADTRLASCHTLESLLGVIGTRLTDDQKRVVYPELLKRLDDSNDQVRVQCCSTLEALVSCCLTSDYDDTNTGYLLKGILIHMDDTNSSVQEAVCRVVERLAKVKPMVVRSGLHEVRDQHRSTVYLDRVLQSM
jgi:dynein assembly factor 5